MTRIKWLVLGCALAVVAAALAGCGGSKSTAADDTAAPAASTGMETMTHSTASMISVESGATDLRVTLDRLLAEHALLATIAMQKGHDGAKDFKPVAGALDANTVDLGKAIGTVYGAKAQASFVEQWRAHIGFFVEYTVATAKNDPKAQKLALDKLAGYKVTFAKFLSDATAGALPTRALSDLLQMHVDQLTAALTTYHAGSYAKAYGQIREAYAHMYMTGDGLAGAISGQYPGKFGMGESTKSASDLRITLDRLLSEHAFLAAIAMQKGYSGAKDFKAAAAALDTNTVDLGKAIGSVYGPKAQTSFLKQWRAHIGFFVNLTVATAKNDQAGRKKALAQLTGYKVSFAKFLSDATGGALPANGVADLLQSHVDQLTAALDTYAAGKYTAAYRQIRAAYAHMFMTGDALAGAIVGQYPTKFSA
jgi:uncharacterized protein (UPF0212 family)